MFLSDTDDVTGEVKKSLTEFRSGLDALNDATGILDANVISIGTSLARLALPVAVIEDTAKLQQLTRELVVESMGQTGIMGDAIMESMAMATYETTQFGVGLDENLKLIQAMNDTMQRNTLLTSEQVVNMQLLARNAGITATELMPIMEGFDNIGVGTDKAIENISSMQKQARDYGINVGQFMTDIGKNIKMLSSYNFADGVAGFSRMVAKAQALRFDVSKTFAMAEGLLEPEKAIEMAAGFQMLGGAVGDLGDPFKLLHMAQTDAEGLQDSIFEMAESAVVFNDKTGEFDIPVTEMYRLREAANLTGIDYQTLTETAIKAAEKTKKLDMLGAMGDFNEKDRELLANLGELDADGQLTVSIPAIDEQGRTITKALSIAELGPEEMEALREMQEQSAMSDREIAMGQLTALQKIAYGKDTAKAATLVAGTKTAGVTDALEGMDAFADTVMDGLNKSINEDSLAVYGQNLTDAIATGFQDKEVMRKFYNIGSHMALTMESAIIDSPVTMKEKMPDDNLLQGVDIVESLYFQYDKLSGKAGELKSAMGDMIPDGLIDSTGIVGDSFETIGDFFAMGINKASAEVGEALDDMMSGEPDYSPSYEPDHDDFISRPGQPIQSFRADDIIIGGTDPFGEKQSNFMNPMDGLSNLGNTLTSFMSNNLLSETQTTDIIDYDKMVNKAIAKVQENLSIPTTPDSMNTFDKLNEIGMMLETNINGGGNTKVDGEVKHNGTITLSLEGRDMKIDERLINTITKDPNFISQIQNIMSEPNTYSV